MSSGEQAHPAGGTYELWVQQFDTLDDPTRARIRDRVAQLSHKPIVTVIMPVYNPPPDLLSATIQSVRGQLYTNWELCIADDCSTDVDVTEILARYEAMDTRIKVTRREPTGISLRPPIRHCQWRPVSGSVAWTTMTSWPSMPWRCQLQPWLITPTRGLSTVTRTSLMVAESAMSRTSNQASIRSCCSVRTT